MKTHGVRLFPTSGSAYLPPALRCGAGGRSPGRDGWPRAVCVVLTQRKALTARGLETSYQKNTKITRAGARTQEEPLTGLYGVRREGPDCVCRARTKPQSGTNPDKMVNDQSIVLRSMHKQWSLGAARAHRTSHLHRTGTQSRHARGRDTGGRWTGTRVAPFDMHFSSLWPPLRVSPAPAQHTRAPASHRHTWPTFRSFSSRAVRAAPPAAISSSILILDLVSWRACRVCLMGCGACWSRLDTCASMARCAIGSVSPKPHTRVTDCAPPKPRSVNHVVGLQPPAAAPAAVGFALSPG